MGVVGFQDSNGKWIKLSKEGKKEYRDSLPEHARKNIEFLDDLPILKFG